MGGLLLRLQTLFYGQISIEKARGQTVSLAASLIDRDCQRALLFDKLFDTPRHGPMRNMIMQKLHCSRDLAQRPCNDSAIKGRRANPVKSKARLRRNDGNEDSALLSR